MLHSRLTMLIAPSIGTFPSLVRELMNVKHYTNPSMYPVTALAPLCKDRLKTNLWNVAPS